ncbi:MAG: hypothetical protein P8J47_03995 [Bacteroidales bacterium]|nr:hypothetical protein [Bacteroidales bacterium]
MNKDAFIGIINNPELLNSSTVNELNGLVEQFPYCQLTRVLLTMNLFKEKSVKYDSELKTTAVYVSSRRLLKKQIDSLISNSQMVVLDDEEDLRLTESYEKEFSSDAKSVIPEDESTSEVDYVIQRHLDEHQIESDKLESAVNSRFLKSGSQIIDEFIKNQPSISRPKAEFYDPLSKSKESIVDNENIVSETLAEIFHDQGHHEKAIKIYRKLSLKYPEKSIYFAALIKKAEKELET